ncbi:MAG: sulfatase-like hydrolase/transferase [Bacteroidota bacterium]
MDHKTTHRISEALKSTGLLSKSSRPKPRATEPVEGSKPNILFVLVDELRFPSVFPKGIETVDEFLKKFMPNVHRLWTQGVKFSNYNTAASACTPARGTLITGLYSQQTWLCSTLTAPPTAGPDYTGPHAPVLHPAFPTYGKLLRENDYQTPYIGKWHVSMLDKDVKGLGLEEYGFEGFVWPDPDGYNLQGTVGYPGSEEKDIPPYINDDEIAENAGNWLRIFGNKEDTAPWCLTASFVNPHDKEFFWAGTEFERYNRLMENESPPAFTLYGTDDGAGAPPVAPSDNPLSDPPSLNYPELPPNWESSEDMEAHKPSTQYMYRKFQDLVWGGAADDSSQTDFTREDYPRVPQFQIGMAPHSYWERGLDCYTQVMTKVDGAIGKVLDALEELPQDVQDNTIVVFASDHGDYAGAHGFLSGKLGSVYKEAYNVPLIVVDPSERFTAQTEVVRDGLVSSVDLLRMLVSFGHKGQQDWLQGDLQQLYGHRLNILPMLKSPEVPGRDYSLLVTDEVVFGFMNFNKAPIHIIGLLTRAGKLGTYAHWLPGTDKIEWESKRFEKEFYDYRREGGQLEMHNESNRPIVKQMTRVLFEQIVPDILRQELPDSLKEAGEQAKKEYLAWEAQTKTYLIQQIKAGLREYVHSFGASF